MPSNPNRITPSIAGSRAMRLSISTALAAGLLSGCAMAGGPKPAKLADGAQSAMEKGKAEKAVGLAEQAVRVDPRNAAYRTTLGDAYLRAGRFAAARQAYDEAMQLGNDKGRTALSLALADIAEGNSARAMDTLTTYRDSIPASDYGLAVALAGQPGQGVAVLANLLRSGENSAKVRQNLAYAYALDGRWADARVMAAQDVPADKLDARITEWAMMGRPEDVRKRVAMLLDVPADATGGGEPQALALANFPSAQQLADSAAQRAAAPQLAAAADKELPAADGKAPADNPAPAVAVATADNAKADAQPEHTAPAELATIELPRSEAAPVIAAPQRPYRIARTHSAPSGTQVAQETREAPAPKASAPAAPARVAVADGTHLVQLGAFSSPEGADRAWAHFTKRDPSLKNYQKVIAHAVVNGHDFWRVMVAGFAGYGSASSLCDTVKTRGGECFVRLDTDKVHPRPGQAATRMASN